MFEIGLFLLLGLCFGSFANVLIWRIPRKEFFSKSRSHCPKCGGLIAWYDNIPVLSVLILRFRCRKCQAPISARYPLVEMITALVFAGLFYQVGWSWTLLEYVILSYGLIVVSFIDLDHMILPDVFTLPGIVIGLVGGFLNPERSFLASFLGVLIGGGILWLVAYVYFLVRRQEGMGGGDIKLLAWIGAVLGWTSIPFVVLFSSIVGSIVGLLIAVRTKGGLTTVIPFGPYIALGAIFIMLGGNRLAEWYIHLFLP